MRFGVIVAGSLLAAWCGMAALAAAPPAAGAPAAPAVSQEAAEFFEKHVRPVLAEKCYSCHGPKISQSSLRVDSLAGLLKGMDGGKTALVPGDPEKSPVIHAVRYTGRVRMPPQGKLAQKDIDALTEWVRMGAPWPGAATQGEKAADPKKHWAFQPVRKPGAPSVKNSKWVKSPIDAFVLAELEKRGMVPSKGADRRTLIRRAYMDLIGLPPTAAETEGFINDKSPTAFATVVDRLLARPEYGERWGRYWLDVARYADTKGYVFQEERRYPNAYTYRDWVIRALNEDMPYDQFLVRQIAADHVVTGDDKRDMAAMGFLTLGRRFLNNQADIIDDRLDVVFRGTQALTVGCARCHDHKFDPIPTADYYSLYGVFASSTEPREGPLIAEPMRSQEYLAFEKQVETLEAESQKFLQEQRTGIIARAESKIVESLMAARELRAGGDPRSLGQKYDIPGELIRRWNVFLTEAAKAHHPVFAVWTDYAAIPDAEFAAKSAQLAAAFAANKDGARLINPAVARAFAGPPPQSLREVADRLAAVLKNPNGDQQLDHALDSIGGPLNIEVGDVERLLDRDARNKLQALRQRVDRLRATSPNAPARAMVLVDSPNPVNPRIFRRGNQNNLGDAVPRQFLAVVAGPERKPFQKGSGRLELAQAITNPKNPLTARVMVNRVWGWHFGQGLVRTGSDFGLRSDLPSHPELLDYLAARFVEDGWSLKKLHKVMLLSSTYQQSSDDNAVYTAKDVENTLLWRMNRRRLDFEAMRDSLLWASGRLDAAMGGAPVDIIQPTSQRRTVYGFIDRQNLPNLFRTFDFASPDSHAPQRYNTTVPQQALFLMNSPFIHEQARSLVARSEVAAAKQDAERVQTLYRILYGRAADADEVNLGLAFLKSADGTTAPTAAQAPPLWLCGFGEVDEATGRVKRFERLTHFTGQGFQGGPALPDPKTGWCLLTAQGGHAGNDLAHATIRRWMAPADGVYRISGQLMHPAAEGDGVRARIVSSRGGVLGTWTAHNSRADALVPSAELKAGDTLDFVVDCRGSVNNDGFVWSPTIRTAAGAAGGASGEWRAAADFGPAAAPGKSLSAWEKYAQVLLLSNEFLFVD